MEKKKEKELVIFDIDGTLIRGQSQRALLSFFFEKKVVGTFYFLKVYLWFVLYRVGLVADPRTIAEYAFSFLAGREVSGVELLIRNFLDEKLKYNFNERVLEVLKNHQKEDRSVVLVSNAVDVLVKDIADFLNIKYYIATRLEMKDSKFTGKISGQIVYGENKLRLARAFVQEHGFSFENTWAYGDHESDVPLLEAVKHPIVVNPDKGLAEIAKKRCWEILSFSK
jgi:HAD superfamily hydrolase (TIGR01490 family)